MTRRLLPLALALAALAVDAAQAAPHPAKAAAPAPVGKPSPAPAPAPAAPSPTPDMAQGFIKTIISQGGTKLYLGETQWYRTPPPGRVYRQAGYDCSSNCLGKESTTAAVLSASSTALCSTSFNLFVKGYEQNDLDDRLVNRGVTTHQPAQSQFAVLVNWNKVTKIADNRDTVTLVGYRYDGSTDMYFSFPTIELAQRVARAMEVLRHHCDPSTSYGF